MTATETIFAPATAPGRGAIGIIRISGADSGAVLQKICGRIPQARRASVCDLRDGAGALLDRGVVLWLPGPGSYTGEDAAELHLHGGLAVLRVVGQALLDAGCRAAEPGEFTRRAFLNGRMDLLEAEGVGDLVAAETEGQLRQALRQMEGEASRQVREWGERLRRVLAWQEALIDFPDEDLPEATARELAAEMGALAALLAAEAGRAQQGARLREGLVFAVTGAPNVGKSSLVNALAGRDVAIVAATPGTTRDALEVKLELGGVPVTLVDTAGLRETDDPVEAEGVRRAKARAAEADLVVHVEAASALRLASTERHVLPVASKIDLAPAPAGTLGVSVRTGAGLAELQAALAVEALARTAGGGNALLSRARHVGALADAADALQRAGQVTLPELQGEELRRAMGALGRITGLVGVEDVLDTVFGAFCIGK